MAKGIFATFANLFTTTVPKAGNVVSEVLTAVEVNASSVTNLSLAGHRHTEIMLVETEQEFDQALADANLTHEQFQERLDKARNRFR